MGNKDSLDLFALKPILEGLEEGVFSCDPGYKIIHWNPAAERILGYTADEMQGSSVYVLIPGHLHEEQSAIFKKILPGGETVHLHTTRITKGKEIIPISLTVSPIKDSAGQMIGISHIFRNIALENLVEAKQGLLAAIIESSDDAIISKTLEGFIITWNKGAEKIFGYTESEVIGRHISILIPHDRMNEEIAIVESIKKEKRIDHFQTIRLHKDGTELHISLTVSAIKNSAGVIIGISKVARNITEQKKAGEIIQQNAGKLEILNSIGKAISEKLDVELILQKVTDATTLITGAAFGAFFYNTVNDEGESYMLFTLSGAPREAFERFGMPRNTAVFHPTFSGESIVRSDDITKDPRYGKSAPHFGMPKGHLPVVSYLGVPVISNSGAVIGGLFFGHPKAGIFTAEHEDLVTGIASQAAIALDNSKLFEEIRELSHKKDEFIALASHELKTPLTSMSGFLQVLQKRISEDANKLFIEKTLGQLRKLNALVNDLLDISKIQSGKLQFYFEQFSLTAFIKEIIDTYSESVSSHKIRFEATCECVVDADKLRLEQAIINLLTNAVKYSPESDKIDILMENSTKEIIVSVKDYGLGISRQNLQHIFSQFYRAGGISRNIPGLGLGLFITKEIIGRHGGRIWAESEPGIGSVFTFTLPVVPAK